VFTDLSEPLSTHKRDHVHDLYLSQSKAELKPCACICEVKTVESGGVATNGNVQWRGAKLLSSHS